MTIALYVLAGLAIAAIYLNVGYYFGRWSWKVYWHSDGKRSLKTLLLFPITHLRDRIGHVSSPGKDGFAPLIGGLWSKGNKERNGYVSVLTFLWPLKIATNSITLLVLVPLFALLILLPLFFISKFTDLVTKGPEHLLKRRAEKKAEPIPRAKAL